VYPSGLTVQHAPNALGQPTQAGTFATGVSYFPNGALKSFTYGNGIVHTATQNARGLPARSTDCTSTGTCAAANRRLDLQYGYDQHGNVTAITDHTSSGRQTRGMSYDALDRLIQTTSPSVFGTASYAYDVLDNLTTVNVSGGSQARNHTYSYDAATQRLSQVKNTVGGAVVANLTYDVQGNLAGKGAQAYQFDLGNRLRSVPGKETGYEYDGHGRRVHALKVSGGQIRSQYGNTGRLLYQQDHKLAKRIDYIYLGSRLVAYRERPSTTTTATATYQHTDALGTPIAVTNASKTLLESSEYEPYGQLVNKALPDGPGFTGHVQDAATGLTYMQQRYYDPVIGTFLSVDPVTAYNDLISQFHRYRYANNNPYRFTDPDGRMIQGLWRYPSDNLITGPFNNPCGEPVCLSGGGERQARPYDEGLKKVQEKYPQVTTEMAGMAFDRFGVDNPISSKSKGNEWAWEMENGRLTPSREGLAGKVSWSVIRGTTQALGHTHGRGDSWFLRYFSGDDVAAAKTFGVPVFQANSHGDFRVFVDGMRLNEKVPEGRLRGGAAAGMLLCGNCVPTGD